MKKFTKGGKQEKQKEILLENRDKQPKHDQAEEILQKKSEAQEPKNDELKSKGQEQKIEESESEAQEQKKDELKSEAQEQENKEEKIISKEAGKEESEMQGHKMKEAEGEIQEQEGRKRKKFLPAVIASVLIIGILLLGYLGGVYYYGKHLFPSEKINGLACGNLTVAETVEQLQERYSQNYSLTIVDREGKEVLTITALDAQMVFALEQEVEQILGNQNAFKWIGRLFAQSVEEKQVEVMIEYDSGTIETILKEAGLFDSNNGEKPQNAYISEYMEDAQGYEIVPEKEGTLLDKELTLTHVYEALEKMETVLNLGEAKCYQQPEITSENEELQAKLAQMNKMVGSCITYDWNGAEEIVDGELIHNWLIIEGMDVALDEEMIADYVAEKAKQYDTYGKKRDFMTTLGIEVSLPSGAYGWKTDREAETAALIELILEGSVTVREPEYISRGWVKGTNDIGNSYVEVDLTNQHLYLYKDGELILETDFVSGDVSKGNATPQGVFGLTYKTTNAVLRGRDYETPVNYWMPFNGNVGMHDATWRRNFGGDIYLTNGSHGCINLPLDMAASIYSQISTGFPVICYYY